MGVGSRCGEGQTQPCSVGYYRVFIHSLRRSFIHPKNVFTACWVPWGDSSEYNPIQIFAPGASTLVGISIKSFQSCPALCDIKDCSPPGSSVHGDSPGRNIGMGCHALLQGIFPTQGWNPGLPHRRRNLYRLSHLGSPMACMTVTNSVVISETDILQVHQPQVQVHLSTVSTSFS